MDIKLLVIVPFYYYSTCKVCIAITFCIPDTGNLYISSPFFLMVSLDVYHFIDLLKEQALVSLIFSIVLVFHFIKNK